MNHKALIIVDPQNDFLPGGALAVPGGNEIFDPILKMLKENDYVLVAVTQDWHPENHGSFASNNGVAPFSFGKLGELDQVFWPNHCVQNTIGAEIVRLDEMKALNDNLVIVQKGTNPEVDSYSGFMDNGNIHETDLRRTLVRNHINQVDVVGLAFDYCVSYTAKHAVELGFIVNLHMAGTRAIEQDSAKIELMKQELRDLGINIIE